MDRLARLFGGELRTGKCLRRLVWNTETEIGQSMEHSQQGGSVLVRFRETGLVSDT